MTASVQIVSAIAAPGQPAAAGAAPQGAATGFDALLAAFFGEGQAVDPALAGLLGQPLAAQASEVLEGEDAVATQDATSLETPQTALPISPEATLALQGVMTPAPAPIATDAAPPAAEPPQGPPAWGQDKAPGAPAGPALAHADAQADLPAKAADALGEDAAAQEPGRSAAAQAPRDGGLGPKIPPATVTTAAPPVPQVAQPPAPPAATAQAAPQAAAQPQAMAAVAAQAAEGEATPAPPPREKPAKSERAQGSTPAARTDAFLPAGTATAPPRVGGAQTFAAADPAAPQAEALEAAALDVAPVEADAVADTPDAQGPAQTASASSAGSAAPPPAHAPVRGSPETVAALAAQIIKKLDSRSSRFDLELHPADLGRVDVRIEINHQGRVSAAMAFDNPQAAQELRSRSGDLQKALEQAGFDLSGGMSFDVAGDHGRGQQGLAERWAEHEAGAGFRGRAFQAALDTAGEADTGAASALNLRRGIRSGVDVRI